MNFFSLLGGGGDDGNVLAVTRLLSRVQHGSVLDERLEALDEIRDLSTKEPVSEHAITQLLELLESQRDEHELTAALLQTISFLIKPRSVDDEHERSGEDQQQHQREEDLQFDVGAEVVLEHGVPLLLDLLEENTLMVRYNCIQLLRLLLEFRADRVQDAVLTHAGALNHVLEPLSDPRELIRNEVLLLLEVLVQGNTAIQGIVSFQGTFERLLDIVKEEGVKEGGTVIAQDCLRIVNELLRHNISNQNYFREMGCLSRLPPLLSSAAASPPTAEEMVLEDSALSLLLEIVAHMVSSIDAQRNASFAKTQSSLGTEEMFDAIFALLRLPSNVVVPLQRLCLLVTLAHCVHKSSACQRNLQRVLVPSSSDQNQEQISALVYLLRVALDSPDIDECSHAMFVLESFFEDNERGQIDALASLTPTPSSPSASSLESSSGLGHELIVALTLWKTQLKSLKDTLRYWSTLRCFSLLVRDSDSASALALSSALEEPGLQQSAPRILDEIAASIAATRSLRVDGRVRMAMLLFLGECLSAEQGLEGSVDVLSHEILMAELKSILLNVDDDQDEMVLGLCAYVLLEIMEAIMSQKNTKKQHLSVLRALIIDEIGVERFKLRLELLKNSSALQDALKEEDETQSNLSEPKRKARSLLRLQLLDRHFGDRFMQVYERCDKHVLALVTLSVSDKAGDEAEAVMSSPKLDQPKSVRSSSPVPEIRSPKTEPSLDAQQIDYLRKRIASLEEGLDQAQADVGFARKEAEASQQTIEILRSQLEQKNQLLSTYQREHDSKESSSDLDSSQFKLTETEDAYRELLKKYKMLQKDNDDLLILLASMEAGTEFAEQVKEMEEKGKIAPVREEDIEAMLKRMSYLEVSENQGQVMSEGDRDEPPVRKAEPVHDRPTQIAPIRNTPDQPSATPSLQQAMSAVQQRPEPPLRPGQASSSPSQPQQRPGPPLRQGQQYSSQLQQRPGPPLRPSQQSGPPSPTQSQSQQRPGPPLRPGQASSSQSQPQQRPGPPLRPGQASFAQFQPQQRPGPPLRPGQDSSAQSQPQQRPGPPLRRGQQSSGQLQQKPGPPLGPGQQSSGQLQQRPDPPLRPGQASSAQSQPQQRPGPPLRPGQQSSDQLQQRPGPLLRPGQHSSGQLQQRPGPPLRPGQQSSDQLQQRPGPSLQPSLQSAPSQAQSQSQQRPRPPLQPGHNSAPVQAHPQQRPGHPLRRGGAPIVQRRGMYSHLHGQPQRGRTGDGGHSASPVRQMPSQHMGQGPPGSPVRRGPSDSVQEVPYRQVTPEPRPRGPSPGRNAPSMSQPDSRPGPPVPARQPISGQAPPRPMPSGPGRPMQGPAPVRQRAHSPPVRRDPPFGPGLEPRGVNPGRIPSQRNHPGPELGPGPPIGRRYPMPAPGRPMRSASGPSRQMAMQGRGAPSPAPSQAGLRMAPGATHPSPLIIPRSAASPSRVPSSAPRRPQRPQRSQHGPRPSPRPQPHVTDLQ